MKGTQQDDVGRSTAAGARRVFIRFLVAAVGLNALVGLGMVAFDVADSIWTTRYYLEETGELIVRACRQLRKAQPRLPPARVVEQASSLFGVDMALFTSAHRLVYATQPRIAASLPLLYGGGKPHPGVEVRIDAALGPLSGAWLYTTFGDHRLLVIVNRNPEDEGLLQYMTFGAGVLALAMALSFVVLLAAGKWLVQTPIQRLVTRLTGELARDNQRRRAAEQRAISARLEAEQHLAFLDNLIDASDVVGIVATDEAGTIQIFNRAAQQILGYDEAEVVGSKTFEELRRRDTGVPSQEVPLRPVIEPEAGEQYFVDKSGQEHLLELRRSEIRDGEGQRAGELWTFVDVTERKRLEADLQLKQMQLIQSAKMASLGEMATGVAHELNQPLNNIGLLTSRLARHRRRLGPEQSEFFGEKLERIQGQVQRAGRIIDQLRSFGRRSRSRLGAVTLDEPVAHVREMLGEQLRHHGIELQVELPAELPAALADAGQLEQVLVNLLINAQDAFRDAPDATDAPTIRIAARETTLDGEPALVLEVGDNGPGMDEDVRSRVFQPFFTTKEVGRGTGLGLSISYSLIRGFGGRLAVESAPGGGATFAITLRVAQGTPRSDGD